MWPVIGGILSGAGSLLGSWFSSDTSARNTEANIAMQRETNAMNAQEAQKNRDFQAWQGDVARNYTTTMSNTAYQRASNDMMQAGLNPAMMFSSGSAASTPSSPVGGGSQATMHAPRSELTSPLSALGDAVSKAFSSAMQVKTFDKMTDEIANLQTERARLEAQTDLIKQSTSSEKQETLRKENVNSLLGLQMPGARFSAKSAEDLESMPEWLRKALVIGGYAGGKASDAIAPVGDLLNSARKVRSLIPSRSTTERTDSRTGDSTFTDRWSGLYN